jgi:flagellar hook-basal body complex protein FliE
MNTVLNRQAIVKEVNKHGFEYGDYVPRADIVANAQDAHTRLELAKAVREKHIINATHESQKGWNLALQAVLKVMEGTK